MRSGNGKTRYILFQPCLLYIEHGLQVNDELPLVGRHLFAVVILEAVDASTRDGAVESVLLLEVAAVGRLAAAHLDFDGDRRLALLAYGDLLVLTLDRRPRV